MTAGDSVRKYEYFPAIDAIKAAAILAVLFTHAGSLAWNLRFTLTERIFREILPNFHVPTFLVLSGFLYFNPSPMSWRTLRKRLGRLLPPYLAASRVAQLGGFSHAQSAFDVAVQFLAGESLGIYYYIFILCVYIVLTPVLSRVHVHATEVALGAFTAYAILSTVHTELSPHQSLFWTVRNPVHTYGYFLAGWVARSRWALLGPYFGRGRFLIIATGVVGLVVYGAANIRPLPLPATQGFFRAVYTFSMIGLLANLSCHRSVPPFVRFLSRNTLTIYLYGIFFQLVLEPHLALWPPLLRILTLATAGLTGAVMIAMLGTRLLGRHALWLLGAQPASTTAAGVNR